MRVLAYLCAVICLLLIAMQVAIVLSVWFGPKENRMNLMAIPMLAPFVFIAAGAIALTDKSRQRDHGGQNKSRLSWVTWQRFAIAVVILQAVLFLAG